MNYCVLIKFSKEQISVWYKLQSEKYAPLDWNGSNDIPLYFYVNGNHFEFGNVAKEKFFSNDPDAYGNYFEITEDPTKYFTIQGNKKPIKQLLYCGIEQLLSNFLNTVVYKQDAIESYRNEFPLRFIFERDIEDKEKVLIENLFHDAGYNNIERINFNKYFFSILEKKNYIPQKHPVLLLNSIDNNLYIDYYIDITHSNQLTAHYKLENEGADPSIQILADKILDYILDQNTFLTVEHSKEINALLPLAEELLEKNQIINKGTTYLLTSNGGPYYFCVRKSEINLALQFNSNDVNITSIIDDALKKSDINASETYFILGNKQINTTYFSSLLLKKYPHVISLNPNINTQVLNSIFEKIENLKYQPSGSTKLESTLVSSSIVVPKNIATPVSPPLPNKVKPPPIPSVNIFKKPDSSTILTKPTIPPVPSKNQKNNDNVIKQPPLPPKKLIP